MRINKQMEFCMKKTRNKIFSLLYNISCKHSLSKQQKGGKWGETFCSIAKTDEKKNFFKKIILTILIFFSHQICVFNNIKVSDRMYKFWIIGLVLAMLEGKISHLDCLLLFYAIPPLFFLSSNFNSHCHHISC